MTTIDFMPGLLHLLRTVIHVYALSLYFNSYNHNFRHSKMLVTAAFCILIMLLVFIFPRGVYKKWSLNVLDFFYLLNLCILCVFLGYDEKAYRAVSASVSFVMRTSYGVLMFHIY